MYVGGWVGGNRWGGGVLLEGPFLGQQLQRGPCMAQVKYQYERVSNVSTAQSKNNGRESNTWIARLQHGICSGPILYANGCTWEGLLYCQFSHSHSSHIWSGHMLHQVVCS